MTDSGEYKVSSGKIAIDTGKIESIGEYHCPEDLYQSLIDRVRKYHPSDDISLIEKAYEIARSCYIEGGNNRIIMASDGDLNVGISSSSELKNYIEQKRDQGVYLSVLGFGTGNYRDSKMETLADNGNGVYLYVDGEAEAEKIKTEIMEMDIPLLRVPGPTPAVISKISDIYRRVIYLKHEDAKELYKVREMLDEAVKNGTIKTFALIPKSCKLKEINFTN